MISRDWNFPFLTLVLAALVKGKISVVPVGFAHREGKGTKKDVIAPVCAASWPRTWLRILILICFKVEFPTRQKFLFLYLMKCSCGIVCVFLVLGFFLKVLYFNLKLFQNGCCAVLL